MNNRLLPPDFYERLTEYVSHTTFNHGALHPANPYQRPLRIQDIHEADFLNPIDITDVHSNKNLILNKILLTIYEQDLLFLDKNFIDNAHQESFREFYAPEFIALGKYLKPGLEYLAFGFLKKHIEVIGHWEPSRLKAYFENVITAQEKDESELCEAIMTSKSPELAAKSLLIQMAPDFLSEASAMARTLTGSFGPVQSELMKVFIDEYGYGVHETKHSTLFEKTLAAVGLKNSLHYYYNDYLPTSLMLVNYFHYISSNKAMCFSYIGALYYTEASIPHFNRQVSALLKNVFKECNTKYFDEHVHIDKHHRQMVMNKIILPSIEAYGSSIIDDILIGFESFRLLQTIADRDFISQVEFYDSLSNSIDLNLYSKNGGEVKFIETAGELTLSHIHDEDEYFTVTKGALSFAAWGLSPVTLNTGSSVFIPKGRLHSTTALQNDTQYKVQSIKSIREVA